MEVLAIIPARSGSKSVKNKNIRPICGKPMLAYSIEHARHSRCITRTIVSTDSADYAAIARKYGAETPFLRPAEYASDDALDYDVFRHALVFLKQDEGYVPDIVVQLRPTYPIRDSVDIDSMVEMLLKDSSADSVRCVAPAKEIPYKMWFMNGQGQLSPVLSSIKEAYNMPRQKLPEVFYQNACIDVIRTSTILEKHSMSGEKILGYRMGHNFDIDTEEDFRRAADYLAAREASGSYVPDGIHFGMVPARRAAGTGI